MSRMVDGQTAQTDCRLLCADECAYGIGPGPVLNRQEPYFTHAGFLQPPKVIDAGMDGIDAALVGVCDSAIVVAFRGTLPPDDCSLPVVLDWLQSFHFEPVTSPLFAGTVHSGFLDAFTRLWPQVKAAIDALRTSHPGLDVHVTGHSKGGAVATLVAWQLCALGLKPARVTTFASPRPGDAAFAQAYTALGLTHTRYENELDAVPFYPPDFDALVALHALHDKPLTDEGPMKWDYAPVGELRFIRADGSVVGDAPGLAASRSHEIVKALIEGHASRVAAAHSLVPTTSPTNAATAGQSTYARGVCPDLSDLSITSRQSIGLNDSAT